MLVLYWRLSIELRAKHLPLQFYYTGSFDPIFFENLNIPLVHFYMMLRQLGTLLLLWPKLTRKLNAGFRSSLASEIFSQVSEKNFECSKIVQNRLKFDEEAALEACLKYELIRRDDLSPDRRVFHTSSDLPSYFWKKRSKDSTLYHQMKLLPDFTLVD